MPAEEIESKTETEATAGTTTKAETGAEPPNTTVEDAVKKEPSDATMEDAPKQSTEATPLSAADPTADTPVSAAVGGTVSAAKRSAVDEAFERLFGYTWGTRFGIDDDAESVLSRSSDARLLLEMFGPTRAGRILQIVPTTKRRRVDPTLARTATKDADGRSSQLRTTMPPSSQASPGGQPIDKTTLPPSSTVQSANGTSSTSSSSSFPSTVPSAASEHTPKTSGAKPSSIDSLLAKISGPAKVNTVQKTSNDWESFKQSDRQLQEELEKKAQAKDAYLVRQDFLTRVDKRRFEIERDERERERAKRATT